MKKIILLCASMGIGVAAMLSPAQTSALGFLNPSFEDPTEGRFWECDGCVNIANYVVQNTGAIDGGRFGVTVNGVAISQRVTVPKKGDTTRLVFWYRNKGNVQVKIKQKGEVIQKMQLDDSLTEWKKMKIDNLPQGEKIRVSIEDKEQEGDDPDGSYAFIDDFKFRKINRTRVTLTVTQDGTPIEDAVVRVVTKKSKNEKKIYTKKNKKVASVTTDSEGKAYFRIDPSTTKKYIVRISKDDVKTTVALNTPEANGKKKLSALMEGLVLPEEDEETPETE